MEDHEVYGIVSEFIKLTKNPEVYIEPQVENADKFKQLAKQIYDFTIASNSLSNLKTKSLRKLLTEGFDEEQIWQQIEIQNNAALPFFQSTIPCLNQEKISFALPDSKINCETFKKNEKFSDESDIENYAFDDDSDASMDVADDDDWKSSTEKVDASKIKKSSPDLDASLELNKEIKNQIHHRKSSKSSEVDDQFFKLSKLKQFLKVEDLKEMKEDSDSDDIDLFEDIVSDDVDEITEGSEEEAETRKSSKDFMYEDFFDAPESGDESIDSTRNNGEVMNRYQKGDASEDSFDEEIEEDFQVENKADSLKVENDTSSALKSAYELEQEKIRLKIHECEKSILEPVSWQLTGEVAASNRPIDSLVHQETEFDSNVKQDLIVDNTVNERVEAIIKMAIMNKAFCDVERKVKPTEDVIAYKKEIALDQAKSKKSLAEVYEEDYLKKQKKQEEEEDPKHKEIKKLMDSLFPELYALFTHIPKPAIPEIKIVSNLPAITVEEVAPTSISDVTLLAPEEVKKKSGLVKGQTERTDTDRKHERRKKKIHQKLKEKKKQGKESQKVEPSGRISKQKKLETLKKLKQNKNTKIANVDEGGKIKSSKDFFSRLQDTMDSKAKFKESSKKKKIY